VLVVARVIFMRRDPGAAKDGSMKAFVVAHVIFERRKPKKAPKPLAWVGKGALGTKLACPGAQDFLVSVLLLLK